ncbi:MAG TPA: carbon-nitrogen hydrolase family protein [Acidimicrobiales bacterium]|nr:carbon-nitrogen hydrolase family protein [Acidimicrobiales bacterium]
MRALLAAVNCPKGDVSGNLQSHLRLLESAARQGCDVAVFPEFSLTGGGDPARFPARAISQSHPAVLQLAEATARFGVTAVFGIAESGGTAGTHFFITQLVAHDGELHGFHRKRHLGEDEEAYNVGGGTEVWNVAGTRFGVVICAEARADFTWDALAAAGADVALFCAAPGLYGRRTDEASWRTGLAWWEECALGDATRNAQRLGLWVALATQSGSTEDEDFPGLAALIDPEGRVTDRLADWAPGTLVVDIPNPTAIPGGGRSA